jgi:hypothetical protein
MGCYTAYTVKPARKQQQIQIHIKKAEKEAYDIFLEYMIYELLVINNPDVAPLSTILKVFMLSGMKD